MSAPAVRLDPARSLPGLAAAAGRRRPKSGRAAPRGFTLVEVLVATALTLIIMAATVTLFANITENIAGSRAIIETNDRLRATRERLTRDLRGATARMLPPLRPEWNLGYFEYVEGVGIQPGAIDQDGSLDTTVGDLDDKLMFTTRSAGEPFVGRLGGMTGQSQIAEVAWFVRGTTLYRRVLLVLPSTSPSAGVSAFYRDNDLSVRQEGGDIDPTPWPGNNPRQALLVANSLGDLTKRENRYGHFPRTRKAPLLGFPHAIGRWEQLGLPTLRECSFPNSLNQGYNGWPFPYVPNGLAASIPVSGVPVTTSTSTDYWYAPHPWPQVEPVSGTLRSYQSMTRIAEDVILTNVIGFDVKAWDPEAPLFDSQGTVLGPGDPGYDTLFGAWLTKANPNQPPVPTSFGAYVDLGYTSPYTLTAAQRAAANAASAFSGPGDPRSQLSLTYDTWSTHYEHDGVDQDVLLGADQGTNGFDDNGVGGVDDASEMEAPPPYPVPLRGIQVKIRVFERDSRQIREVTLVQDFLPE